MATLARDLPRALVERIEAAHPAPAIFGADEVAEWPDGAIEALMRAGLLQEARRASTVICDGCEWSCAKPIVVRAKNPGGERIAFVTCDEEPDLGRVSVPLGRLAQYQTTMSAMAQVLTRALDIVLEPKPERESSISLGSIKGRYGDRVVCLVLHNRRLQLTIGQQHETLSACLRWDEAKIRIDRAIVRRLANRKEQVLSHGERYRHDRSARSEKKRETTREDQKIIREARRRRLETDDSWTSIADQIAKTPLALRKNGRRLTAGRVRRIVTRELGR